MPTLAPFAAGLAALALSGCAAEPPPPESPELWSVAVPFERFLADAERRVETWHANWERARVPDELLGRAGALEGTWRLLVVAEDWCGDSANTVPYLARLAADVPGLELRIVDSDVGRDVMNRHPTPDGRAATPTVLVLAEDGSEAGCWVERPSELQRWWIENPEGLDRDAQLAAKYAWYDDDAGVSTMREIVERLEAAAAGTPVCGVPADGGGAEGG